MSLVEIEAVTKSFAKGDQTITPLKEASLSIERGDFVSLMGASGSGKSTLLNLVAGIDRPTAGRIVVDGEEITRLSRTKLARWRAANVGYIFQMHNLIPVLTAYENVELPLLLLPMSKAERKQQVLNALEIVNLADRMNHRPGQLSGGQCQRVGIARAIVTDPTIIVADEPTGALDARSADAALDLLNLLRTELGKTIMMVTHDPTAAKCAQRIVHLEKGRLVGSDTYNTTLTAAARPVSAHSD